MKAVPRWNNLVSTWFQSVAKKNPRPSILLHELQCLLSSARKRSHHSQQNFPRKKEIQVEFPTTDQFHDILHDLDRYYNNIMSFPSTILPEEEEEEEADFPIEMFDY